MLLRPAEERDLPRLLAIYNHYIEHTAITFDVTPLTLAARRLWFADFQRTGPHQLFVGEVDGRVEGYASTRVFRARAAYDRSVEASVYLDSEACGAGLGSALYARLLEAMVACDEVHRIYAGITLPNEASVALHHRCGFQRVGTFSEVGFKFDQYWDVAWFELAV